MGDLGDEERTKFDGACSAISYDFRVVPFNIEQHLEFIDISEDGHLLIGSSNLVVRNWIGSVWLFPTSDVKPLKEESITGHGCESPIACGTFLDSSEKVVIGEDTGKLTALKVNEYENGSKYFLPFASATHHDSSIVSICVTNSKLSTVSAGSCDLRINIWDNENWELQEKYCPAHSLPISQVIPAFDKESQLFLSCSVDGLALIWDPRQSKPANGVFESKLGLKSACWLDESQVALGNLGGEVELVDVRTKGKLHSYPTFKSSIHHITSNGNGLLATCGDSNVVKVWNTKTNRIEYTDETRHTGLVRGLSWHPQNGKLYSCGFDRLVQCHDISTSSGS